jgi:ADP-ribose pyrophosphatase YjhB (NUDIX family)
MEDIVGAGERWIPEPEYRSIVARVPILCADLLPLSPDVEPRVGLVRRETYDGMDGWCLVGGAVLKDEPATEAVGRHLRATLGDRVHLDRSTLRLLAVIEYFTDPGIGEFHDPRKHAVSLTYVARCSGRADPHGEALEFRWFRRDELDELEYGFNQGAVVHRLLNRMDERRTEDVDDLQ